MINRFRFVAGSLVPTETDELADVLIYKGPDDHEKKRLLAYLSIDANDIESALDADEISRAKFTADCASLIWKRPKNVSVQEQLRFDVGSMGLFLHRGRLVVITGETSAALTASEFQGCSCTQDVFLKLLDHTERHFLGHLKVIKQITAELGSKIAESMDNQYLVQMLVLGESLIYYINAIEANGGVLAKLETHVQQLGLNPAQIEQLHDLAIDNQQCARQARIYSDVVSGLMDARGTILNNNVSILLKKLTLINIIFLPLNLIASIGGMSEFSMMTQGVDWRVSYSLFGIAMVTLGWASWHALLRMLQKRHRSS